MIGNGRADRRDLCRACQLDPVQEIPAELRDPQLLPVWAERDAVCHCEVWEHGRDRLKSGET